MVGQWFPDAVKAVKHLQRRTSNPTVFQEQRQKFVEGHQLIHDRKKNEPCIPILQGHDQEAWFEKLDSNGIWEKVLEFLTTPSDMTSAYFAFETFRKHLEERRKMMLLPKVFQVFRDTERLQYSGIGNFRTGGQKKADKEILKQRLVSKAWKKSVEDVFLVPLNVSPSKPIWHPDSWNWRSPMVCTFRRINDVDKAIKMLQNASTCAPIVRLVVVDECKSVRDGKRELFHSKVSQFFEIHGEGVWGLWLHLNRVIYSEDIEYDTLWNLVSRIAKMPQIKALRITENWSIAPGLMPFNRVAAMDLLMESVADFRPMIAERPFPSMPTLEFLQFNCVRNCSEPPRNDFLVAEILNKSSNLKAVILGYGNPGYDNQFDVIHPFVWDELRNLRLKYLELDTFLDLKNEFFQLKEFEWPLEYLRLGDCRFRKNSFVPASNFFAVLNNFNESLVEADFGNGRDCCVIVKRREKMIVDFPKLKKIGFPPVAFVD